MNFKVPLSSSKERIFDQNIVLVNMSTTEYRPEHRPTNIRSDPLPSCLCFELLAVTDSLAIRVATVPISIPFSVQSKISERFQVL